MSFDVTAFILETFERNVNSYVKMLCLRFGSQLPQTPDGGSDRSRGRCRVGPGTSGDLDSAVLRVAAPDADSLTFHVVLKKIIDDF
jgi:hypothetical protein